MYRFLLLVLLCIWSVNQTEATCLKYNRKDYRHWIDEDRDCQNTRNEVLIQEFLDPVTYKSSKGCKVSSGKWHGSFTSKLLPILRNLTWPDFEVQTGGPVLRLRHVKERHYPASDAPDADA